MKDGYINIVTDNMEIGDNGGNGDNGEIIDGIDIQNINIDFIIQ